LPYDISDAEERERITGPKENREQFGTEKGRSIRDIMKNGPKSEEKLCGLGLKSLGIYQRGEERG